MRLVGGEQAAFDATVQCVGEERGVAETASHVDGFTA
jgi:hypothetical protein